MEEIKDFRVGDIVELVKDHYQYKAGTKGIIKRTYRIKGDVNLDSIPMGGEEHIVVVELPDGLPRSWFPHRLKLVLRPDPTHFYVGDTVKLKENHGRWKRGDICVITRTYNFVDFDNCVDVPSVPMNSDMFLEIGNDGFFAYRFTLVKRGFAMPKAIDVIAPVADVPIKDVPKAEESVPITFEGFQPGDMVIYTNEKGNRLVTNYWYTIAKVYPKNLIRVNGFSSLWSTKHFRVVKREPIPVPMKKPVLSLNQQLKAKNPAGLCSFAIQYEKSPTRFLIAQACHAPMGHWQAHLMKEKVLAVACDVSYHYRITKHKEAFKNFIDYIINHSPWKKFYIPKPIDAVLEDGIELDVSKPNSQVVAAAIALRIPHEYSARLEQYQMALDMGFSETVAFLVFQFTRINKDNLECYLHGGGHNVISADASNEALLSLFTNGYPQCTEEPYAVQHSGYSILRLVAQDRNKPPYLSALVKNSKYMKNMLDEWGGNIKGFIGKTLQDQVANACNCFISLGFK